MSHRYNVVRGKVEELMKDFDPLTIWDLPEARSTCWNMGAAAMATVANLGKLLHESRHLDPHTWAFELVPSVLISASVERVPRTNSVRGAEATRKYIMLARGGGVQRRIQGGAATQARWFCAIGAVMR